MLHDAALPSYTTAGRHRRQVGPGRIRLDLRPAWGDTGGLGAVEVLVNGFPVTATEDQTVIQVPSGPMCVEVCPVDQPRSATTQVEFVLGDGELVDLSYTAAHLLLGAGRLRVEAVQHGFG